MATIPAPMPWPADDEIFEAGVGRRRLPNRAGEAFRKLWAALRAIPDRGAAATPDDVPQEFYRFPMV